VVNLRAIANRMTSGINPNITASLRKGIGYTVGHGFKGAAEYAAPADIVVQIQALTKRDVEHLDSLNISDCEIACYSNAQLTCVDRKDQSGGDLLRFTNPATGTTDIWLATAVLEAWPTAGWSRIALTKQLDTTWPNG
jgi:hypothetical protein